jgi:hypothetical protein
MYAKIGDALEKLAQSAFNDFSNTADYIWKSPRLIEHETALEIQKLKDYYPNDPDSKRIRWQFEKRKLSSVFPHLIAIGNLFSVLSLFEMYLLLLANELSKVTSVNVKDTQGQGVYRMLKYLRNIGINTNDLEYYYEIQAAIKIRNCLIHISGFIDWAKDGDEIKRLCKNGSYLNKIHRQRRIEIGDKFDEVELVPTKNGARLEINNNYSFIVTSYLRDYFLNLCKSAQDFIAKKSIR